MRAEQFGQTGFSSLGAPLTNGAQTCEPLSEWLNDRPSIRIISAATRIKAMQLTQLLHHQHLRGVACHDFVRALKLQLVKRPARCAAEVINGGAGTALEKSNELVALLRSCAIPARLHVYAVRAHHLRGLTHEPGTVLHPIVEAFIGGRWVATDTYHLDMARAVGGRAKLLREGMRCGYGVHLDGPANWNGLDDSLALFSSNEVRMAPVKDWGVFHDAEELVQLTLDLRNVTGGNVASLASFLASCRTRRLRASSS